MIKKISQLNPLPEEFYDDSKLKNDEELRRKLSEMLLEVSYETNRNNEAVSYYNSYNCTLNTLSDILDLDRVWAVISSITNGGISVVAVNGDLQIGVPGNGTVCDAAPTHQKYPNDAHDVSCYYKIYQHNDLICHQSLDVHGATRCYGDLYLLDPSKKFYNSGSEIVGGDVHLSGGDKTFTVDSNATFTKAINGTAYRAQWGDLAEIYSADAEYEPGTLVKFGGKIFN